MYFLLALIPISAFASVQTFSTIHHAHIEHAAEVEVDLTDHYHHENIDSALEKDARMYEYTSAANPKMPPVRNYYAHLHLKFFTNNNTSLFLDSSDGSSSFTA